MLFFIFPILIEFSLVAFLFNLNEFIVSGDDFLSDKIDTGSLSFFTNSIRGDCAFNLLKEAKTWGDWQSGDAPI